MLNRKDKRPKQTEKQNKVQPCPQEDNLIRDTDIE